MINGKIIKVCGMREAENIQDVESIEGIDMLGFIFYPKSPRYVYELPAYLPIHARRVGVFVNEDKQIISMYADRFGLNYVQLHGNESPEYCRSLHSTGLKIIKAFSVDRPKDLRKVYDYEKVCDLFQYPSKIKPEKIIGYVAIRVNIVYPIMEKRHSLFCKPGITDFREGASLKRSMTPAPAPVMPAANRERYKGYPM